MAFPPDQTSGRGDKKSLQRASWNNTVSLNAAFEGGNYNWAYGNDDFKYDDAEGWAPRIQYHGTTVNSPFDGVQKNSYGGSVYHEASTSDSTSPGFQSLRRKDNGADTSSTTSTPIVLKMRNATAGEIYTTGYGTVASTKDYYYLVTRCTPDSTWHCTWYAKSYQSAQMQFHIFGVKDVTGWGSFGFNFTGNVSVNATTSSPTDIKTGGTRYYHTQNLTTQYVKYNMTFKFNGDTDIAGIMMRIDINTGGSTMFPKDINIDRITLHQMNVSLKDSQGVGTTDIDLDGTTWQTY
jgi:hypothetical protein|tara:strand:- start:528 stop:1406 length:879 start_codon:yes stop_codon:yes gene_type:complete